MASPGVDALDTAAQRPGGVSRALLPSLSTPTSTPCEAPSFAARVSATRQGQSTLRTPRPSSDKQARVLWAPSDGPASDGAHALRWLPDAIGATEIRPSLPGIPLSIGRSACLQSPARSTAAIRPTRGALRLEGDRSPPGGCRSESLPPGASASSSRGQAPWTSVVPGATRSDAGASRRDRREPCARTRTGGRPRRALLGPRVGTSSTRSARTTRSASSRTSTRRSSGR